MLISNELQPKYERVPSPPQGYDEMSTMVEDIYTSAPSKFIVDGKALYIHAKLVSRHSEPLNAEINAKKDFIMVEGVDKDTFVRFIEWAYKGYYTEAEYRIDAESPSLPKFEDSDTCTPVGEPTEPPAEPATFDDLGWSAFGKKDLKKKKKAAKMMFDEDCYPPSEPAAQAMESCYPPSEPEPQAMKSSKESLKEAFYARKYEIRQDTITIPPPRPNKEPNENYADVFLSHVHLYVFARRYDIPSLQTLALENLHMTLDSFTLFPERTGDIIELLKYIYSSRELREGAEDMREMLRGYIGFQMDILMKDRGFRGLMKEEGALLDDFVEMVGKRIG